MPPVIDHYIQSIVDLLTEHGQGLALPMMDKFRREITHILRQDISTILPGQQEQSTAFINEVRKLLRPTTPTNKLRLVVMPAGGYGQWLAAELANENMETVAFLDNFKAGEQTDNGITIKSPPELSSIDFDYVVLATPTLSVQQQLADQLTAIIGSPEKIIMSAEAALAAKINKLQQQSLEVAHQYSNKINAIKTTGQQQKIIFAVPAFAAHYLPTIRALRRRGHKVILVSNNSQIMYGPRVDEYSCEFDLAISSDNNILALLMTVSQSQADCLYGVDHSLHNFLALLIRDLWPHKMVMEVYDFSDNVQYAKGEGIRGMEKQLGGIELEGLEDYARQRLYPACDGLIYRDSPQLMERAREIYHLDTPSLRFLPYPERYDKLKQLDNQEHLVFCGHILNRPDDLVYTILPLARELASQQIHLHIFNPADPLRQAVPAYINEANNNPFIHYHRPVASDILNYVMRQYNWAWLVYDFADQDDYAIMRHELTFTSRLLAYINAGLPCICSKESTYQVEIIKEYNIGIIVERADIPQLGSIIAQTDYKQLCANVKKLRREWDMGKQIGSLEYFLTHLAPPSHM